MKTTRSVTAHPWSFYNPVRRSANDSSAKFSKSSTFYRPDVRNTYANVRRTSDERRNIFPIFLRCFFSTPLQRRFIIYFQRLFPTKYNGKRVKFYQVIRFQWATYSEMSKFDYDFQLGNERMDRFADAPSNCRSNWRGLDENIEKNNTARIGYPAG